LQPRAGHDTLTKKRARRKVPPAQYRKRAKAMIHNLVLDMSGVLIYFDAHVFMVQAGVPAADEEQVRREVYASPEWAEIDRGTITDEAAAAAIQKRLPARLGPAVKKLVTMQDRPILPVPGMRALLADAKAQGCGIYLLSNTGRHQRAFWPRIPGSEYFDGCILSAEWQLVKPQPEIYRLLAQQYGLALPECLFVDDTRQNVEAARACGMQGFWFQNDAAALREALRAAGLHV
jgi:putative hydrolase of the HAD superfamily